MIKQLAINAVLFAVMLYLAVQGKDILNVVRTKTLEVSPVTYSELIPDKEEYTAGDLVRFSYDRTCKVDDKLFPLMILVADSFENLDTGEIFPGISFVPREVHRNGTEHLKALRRLSIDCTPGTYSLEGWVNIQGSVPTQPMPYSSRKFKVGPSPNRAQP